MPRATTMRLPAAIAAAFALAACNELPQDGPKPFAAKHETRSYEAALADRVNTQDEYPAMESRAAGAGAQGRTRTASSRSQ
jgi:hypothetical protein